MTPQTIRAAMAEAERFITAATDLLAREEAERAADEMNYSIYGSKASGATRRASLDLTRALAEMRKP